VQEGEDVLEEQKRKLNKKKKGGGKKREGKNFQGGGGIKAKEVIKKYGHGKRGSGVTERFVRKKN